VTTCLTRTATIFRVLAITLAALTFAACAPTEEPQGIWGKLWKIEVGPNYKAPEMKVTDEYRAQLTPEQAASLADLPWWQVFNDPALQNLIEQALTHNYSLQVAVANVSQARSMVWVAASPLYPQAGYQAFAGRQKTFFPFEEAGGNVTFNAFGALLNMVWELDVWGRVRRSTEAARAQMFAQEDVRRGVMLTLVSDVATDYYSLLELDREMAIAHESSKVYKQTLDLFTDRFNIGKDSKLPVARAEANYQSSLADIARLQRAIFQEENAISVLTGAYPEAIQRGAELTAQQAPSTPLGLTTALMRRRPDLLQAEQNMIGSNAMVGVAVANFFPTIGVSALYGGQSPKIGDVFDERFSIWNILGNMTGPIFQGGALLYTYYAQQAYWDATVAQYKQTVLVAFEEVSDALIAQQTLVTQRTALEGRVSALKEAVELAFLRYNAGRASYFEVLEAEQQLFPTQDALAQTQRDQLLAVVSLYKALGGGWNLSDAQWVQRH
jgi:multidrug efflux system outer membrane protein